VEKMAIKKILNKKLVLISVATVIIVVGLFGLIWFILILTEPTPLIESISPSSGTVGTKVTIKGSNFHPKNNVIHFICEEWTHCFYFVSGEDLVYPSSEAFLENIPSSDGKTLTFTIPYVLKGGVGRGLPEKPDEIYWEEVFLPVGEIDIAVSHKGGDIYDYIKFTLESKGKTKIEQAKEKLLKELMTIEGVVGGGIGMCKVEWEEPPIPEVYPMPKDYPMPEVPSTIDHLCIKVYLEKDSLELRKKIPSQFEGFKVDIEVTGPIDALPITKGRFLSNNHIYEFQS